MAAPMFLFADDETSLTLDGLTVENGTRSVALYLEGGPSLDVRRDREGLRTLLALSSTLEGAARPGGADPEEARGHDFGQAVRARAFGARTELSALVAHAVEAMLNDPALPDRLPPVQGGDSGTVPNPFT